MTERRVLVTVGLVVLLVLAGCSAAGSLEMQPVTDEDLAAEASRPAEIPDDEPIYDRRLVRAAIENGSATAQDRSPPVESGLPFAHEGRYYNLTWTVTDRRPGIALEIAIDYNGTAPENETVAYESLSARDREVLEDLLPPRIDTRTEGYDFGVRATYDSTERNRSVLLSEEYAAVSYEGETYRIDVQDTESVTIKTYRYTPTTVANGTAEYARQLREDHLFTLSNLTADERAIVDEAINDTYYADSTDDQAFESVTGTFRQHGAIRKDEYRGTWLVRYDGEVYLAELSYDGFDEE